MCGWPQVKNVNMYGHPLFEHFFISNSFGICRNKKVIHQIYHMCKKSTETLKHTINGITRA